MGRRSDRKWDAASRSKATESVRAEATRRRNVRRRLVGTARRLEAARDRLVEMHSDRSGMARRLHRPPLLEREWRGSAKAPGLQESFARIYREAEEGCDLSASFLAEWREVFELCRRLRLMALPERAPDFDPTRERYWRVPLPPPMPPHLDEEEEWSTWGDDWEK